MDTYPTSSADAVALPAAARARPRGGGARSRVPGRALTRARRSGDGGHHPLSAHAAAAKHTQWRVVGTAMHTQCV